MFAKKKTVILELGEVTCNVCVANVEKALLSVKGVKKVETSVEDKKVTVTAKDWVCEATLKETVQKYTSHD